MLKNFADWLLVVIISDLQYGNENPSTIPIEASNRTASADFMDFEAPAVEPEVSKQTSRPASETAAVFPYIMQVQRRIIVAERAVLRIKGLEKTTLWAATSWRDEVSPTIYGTCPERRLQTPPIIIIPVYIPSDREGEGSHISYDVYGFDQELERLRQEPSSQTNAMEWLLKKTIVNRLTERMKAKP